MFLLFRLLGMQRRMAQKARLVDLARRMDEVLLSGSLLTPETRHVLQHRRDDLENQIRALSIT